MSQTAKPQTSASATATTSGATEPAPPYRRVYAWVFQAWLIMFLGVICSALIFYLLSYIPK